MSSARPKVAPDLIASLIDSTPDRVRRRLDRSPDAAAAWSWQITEEAWCVSAGEETVTLPKEHVLTVEQIKCTCLLSPRCFHVLACVTHLEVAVVEAPSEPAPPAEPSEADPEDDTAPPTDKQRRAAQELLASLGRLLHVGVANAGVVVQSGLLRAVHQCRAEGLHRLAALGLRVSAGAGEFRSRAPSSDPAQLAEDIADILETARHVLSNQPIASFWIGTARRKQFPVRPRKLHGLFAEPIITRSGFCGAAVYFLGEDERIYTASDVRPGDAQHVRDAYHGGIEIGPLIQPARQLARGLYLGTDLTASAEGRLGRGRSIRIVEQGQSTWRTEAIQRRFQHSLADQWNAVYAQAALPTDARRAGWDFIFVEGVILGAMGPELILQAASGEQLIRLAIENENDALCFRENLRMLSHAPGLRLRIIARLNLQDPHRASALAVSPLDGERQDSEPRLEVPKAWADRVCLGFDELQRPFFVNAQPAPAVVMSQETSGQPESPLAALRRRWVAAMLAGLFSQRPRGTNLLSAEMTHLNQAGFATGAALLDALTGGPSRAAPAANDTFLATSIYLRTCSHELARSTATLQA